MHDTSIGRGLDAKVDRLYAILCRQCTLQTDLHERLKSKRCAIAQADMAAIERLCREENELSRSISALETERLELVGSITQTIDPTRNEPMRVADIASHVGGARGSEIQDIADAIRGRLKDMHALAAVLRDATETLNAHIAGVMQVVHSTFSNTRMYERRGRIHCGAQIASTLDVTS